MNPSAKATSRFRGAGQASPPRVSSQFSVGPTLAVADQLDQAGQLSARLSPPIQQVVEGVFLDFGELALFPGVRHGERCQPDPGQECPGPVLVGPVKDLYGHLSQCDAPKNPRHQHRDPRAPADGVPRKSLARQTTNAPARRRVAQRSK